MRQAEQAQEEILQRRPTEPGSFTGEGEEHVLDRIDFQRDKAFSEPFAKPGGETMSVEAGGVPSIVKTLHGMGGGGELGSSIVRQVLNLAKEDTLRRPFLQSIWAYIAMETFSENAASVPLRFYTSRDLEEEITANEGPPEARALAELFARPNPLPTSSRRFWKQQWLNTLLAGGSVWLAYDTGSGKAMPVGQFPDGKIPLPDELWHLRRDLTRPEMAPGTRLPKFWTFTSDGMYIRFPAHSTVPVTKVDPHDPVGAMGPTQAAFRTLQMDFQAERYDEGLLANGGNPGWVITAQHALGKEARDSIRESMREEHQVPGKEREVLVLPHDLKLTVPGFKPREMEFQAMRKEHRVAILAAYGVTPTVVGITEDVNRANARETKRAFWEDHVIPGLEWLADEIRTGFIGRLDGVLSEVWAEFDWSNVPALRGDLSTKIKDARQLMEMGYSRKRSAFIVSLPTDDDQPEDDERFIASSLTPIGDVVEPDEDSEEESAGDVEEKLYPCGLTLAQRNLSLLEYDKRLSTFDNRLFRTTRQFFRDYLGAQRAKLRRIAGEAENLEDGNGSIRKILTDAEIEEILLGNSEKWRAELAKKTEPVLRAAWTNEATAFTQEFALSQFVSVADPEVLLYLSKKAVRLAEGAESFVADQVRKAIVKGLDEANQVGTVARQVRGALTELERSLKRDVEPKLGRRAMTIARTETTAAAGNAQGRQIAINGASAEWGTLGDEFVRQLHADLNGTVREIDPSVNLPFEFLPGLRHPGDPNARAELVVHCRCRLFPIIRSAA